MSDLARAIRAWRDRVTPAQVGLPAGVDRRSPGLRREELAALAGVSVDYLVRLEQGRATNPSPQVLGSLSRALRLTVPERDLLFRSAGIAPPSPAIVSRHLSPGLQRIIDRLDDTPVGVFSAAWDFVVGNRLWSALFGDQSLEVGRSRNLVWRTFTGLPDLIRRSDDEMAAFQQEMVADLHTASTRYPDDPDLRDLIRDLRGASDPFRSRWEEWTVAPRSGERKTIESALVGPVTFDCDVLAASDSDLRVVVYTAVPETVDAEKLNVLRVAGIQELNASKR